MVIHIANSLAVLAELESTTLEDAPEIQENAWLQLRISKDSIPELLHGIQDEVADLLKIFIPS